MFSFTSGEPVAKIINPGKPDNNKIIRITNVSPGESTEKEIIYNDPFDIIEDDDVFASRKIYKSTKLDNLKKWLREEEEPDIETKKLFGDVKKKFELRDQKEIILNSGQIVPVPMIKENQRQVIYVAGPSGSGKSTFCAAYMREFKKQFPKRKIYVFSRVQSDETIDKIKPIRIKLNDELINDPITPEELEDSLVLFDDIDTITDNLLKESITKLRDDLLETGRHQNVYMLITSHLLMNYKQTRTIINEATMVVMFGQSGSTYHITRFLKVYGGLDKKQIEKVLKLPSRWFGLSKTFPQYIIYNSGIYLLSK